MRGKCPQPPALARRSARFRAGSWNYRNALAAPRLKFREMVSSGVAGLLRSFGFGLAVVEQIEQRQKRANPRLKNSRLR